MEHIGRVRALSILAAVAVAVVALARPASLVAGDPPRDPPPCPPGSQPGAGTPAWFSLASDLDESGWLVGRRLSVGDQAGSFLRRLELAPESFASGPIRGRVLVGDDDGTRSRLRVLDVGAGCAVELGHEASVVRSAILSADGRTVWEHRVNRATRADEGVWRRPTEGGPPRRVLPGMPLDARYGPTFSTELSFAADGRLVVVSCGEVRCRSRILDTRTGRMDRVDRTGPLIGVGGGHAIAYAPCHGFPCRIEAVDLSTGGHATLVEGAGPAVLAGADARTLVFQTETGSLAAMDLVSKRRTPIGAGPDDLPVRGGSAATSGADLPAGSALLAPGGHLTNPAAARRVDVATGSVDRLGEVAP